MDDKEKVEKPKSKPNVWKSLLEIKEGLNMNKFKFTLDRRDCIVDADKHLIQVNKFSGKARFSMKNK